MPDKRCQIDGRQVVRNLLLIRYQPSAILVVNSPIEAPVLTEEVMRGCGGIDAKEHKVSLLADARAGSDLWKYEPALRRLGFIIQTSIVGRRSVR